MDYVTTGGSSGSPNWVSVGDVIQEANNGSYNSGQSSYSGNPSFWAGSNQICYLPVVDSSDTVLNFLIVQLTGPDFGVNGSGGGCVWGQFQAQILGQTYLNNTTSLAHDLNAPGSYNGATIPTLMY